MLAPDLPFEDPDTTYEQRAQVALDVVEGHGEPVVVVGHSLGAGYAPLVAAVRAGSSLVYACPAPVGPFAGTGAPMRSTRPGFTFPPDRADRTSVWDPDEAASRFYARLPAATASEFASSLRRGAAPANRYPLVSAPDVPTGFIYAHHDEFFEPAWSRWVAEDAGLVPVELDTGHFPMIEAPEALAAALDRMSY